MSEKDMQNVADDNAVRFTKKVSWNHYRKCIPVPFGSGKISDKLFKNVTLLHTTKFTAVSHYINISL